MSSKSMSVGRSMMSTVLLNARLWCGVVRPCARAQDGRASPSGAFTTQHASLAPLLPGCAAAQRLQHRLGSCVEAASHTAGLPQKQCNVLHCTTQRNATQRKA